jgi:hypothetical protein
MPIVIATAEPQGAYHLHALYTALRSSPCDLRYLSPDVTRNVGNSPIPTTDDVSLIGTAERLILTGGTYTHWTSSLHRFAESCGVEVRYSELAFLDPEAERGPYTPQACSATSDASATTLAEYLGVAPENVLITGNPLVPQLGESFPVPGRVLIVSTVDAETRDPALHLRTAARELQRRGLDVVVRLHPRENPAPWGGFTLDDGSTITQAVIEAELVLAYPGTPLQVVAQLGTPLIVLTPTSELEATAALTTAGVSAPWARDSTAATSYALALMSSARRPVRNGTTASENDPSTTVVRFWTQP